MDVGIKLSLSKHLCYTVKLRFGATDFQKNKLSGKNNDLESKSPSTNVLTLFNSYKHCSEWDAGNIVSCYAALAIVCGLRTHICSYRFSKFISINV